MQLPAIFLVPLVVMLLFSCQEGNSISEISDLESSAEVDPVDFDLDRIKERGVLRAIIDNNSTSYFIYKGEPMGYEYELLTRFAESQGLKLELVISPDLRTVFDMLNDGKGDVIAYNLTVTKERSEKLAFATNHSLVRQVLVQRKPENWRDLKIHEIENLLIRNPIELIGKEVVVRGSSAFVPRLKSLSEEIGGDIIIHEEQAGVSSEALMERVAEGSIRYTVADENVALINATYYPILDVQTPVSFSQRIAWAVRKNAPQLLEEINNWIGRMKKTPDYNVIYDKYYRNPKNYLERVSSGYIAVEGGPLSLYDDLIKQAADTLGWDWRFLAALVFRESKFDPKAKSWVGAVGLMQLMPNTAKAYGVRDLYEPAQNIMGGTKHLQWLEKYWSDKVLDSLERQKFVLASYNVGHEHVLDAQNLAEKYSRNPMVWDDNVAYFLLQKSRAEYFKDPIVRRGYCRGEEPYNYVKEIEYLYKQYSMIIEI